MDDIVTTGQELIETGHIKADNVKAKVEEITQLWQDLVTASELKSVKLQEASQQQQFNRGVEDLELWLSEVEGQLNSEDCGKDITSVQNLQKKQALLEADVGSHQDRIEGVRIQADQFNQAGHFDAENILAKYANLGERYNNLMDPLTTRQQRLKDSAEVQKLFRDVEDEEAWIREKEPIVASNNRGRDLIGVQNLIKKHQAMQAEINNHEPSIDAVSQAAQHMVEEGHFASEDIKSRLMLLHDHWNQLKEKSAQRFDFTNFFQKIYTCNFLAIFFKYRKQDLEDSLQAHQYFADANEAESWMKEKEPLAGNNDYGKDEDASEALLKRHEAFMSDLKAFGTTIQDLKEQASNCRQQETPVAESAGKECVMALYDYTEKSGKYIF